LVLTDKIDPSNWSTPTSNEVIGGSGSGDQPAAPMNTDLMPVIPGSAFMHQE
jgi:hypothetical protein